MSYWNIGFSLNWEIVPSLSFRYVLWTVGIWVYHRSWRELIRYSQYIIQTTVHTCRRFRRASEQARNVLTCARLARCRARLTIFARLCMRLRADRTRRQALAPTSLSSKARLHRYTCRGCQMISLISWDLPKSEVISRWSSSLRNWETFPDELLRVFGSWECPKTP